MVFPLRPVPTGANCCAIQPIFYTESPTPRSKLSLSARNRHQILNLQTEKTRTPLHSLQWFLINPRLIIRYSLQSAHSQQQGYLTHYAAGIPQHSLVSCQVFPAVPCQAEVTHTPQRSSSTKRRQQLNSPPGCALYDCLPSHAYVHPPPIFD